MARPHYAFIIVAVTFLTLFATASVRGLPGVILRSLEAEFGWERAEISLAVAISLVTFGLGGLLGGRTVERFGARTVTVIGVLCVVSGLAAMFAVATLWQLYLFWGVMTGLGTGVAGAVVGAAIAHRWFRTHRGLVVGHRGGRCAGPPAVR